jgi:hypothetical protein
MPTALFNGLAFQLELFRVAQVLLAYRASSAVLAKVRGGLDQFFKRNGIGFDKALFLEGTEGFFFGIAHVGILSIVNIRPG